MSSNEKQGHDVCHIDGTCALMILEPVTGARRRAASLPTTGRPTPSSVPLAYPSFQCFKPPDLLAATAVALQPNSQVFRPGNSTSAAPLLDSVPGIPLTFTPPFMPALPAMESNFEFIKSPVAKGSHIASGHRDDLRGLERHLQDLLQGQEGLRKELHALKSQAAAQSRELDLLRQRSRVGRPKLPPTRSPDAALSFPSEGKPAGPIPRAGSRPRNVLGNASNAQSAWADPAASVTSRSQHWDDTVADCLLCTR